MLMINRQHHLTVEVPPWDPPQYQDQDHDHPDNIISPQTKAYFTSLHRFPCSTTTNFSDDSLDSESCDEFRMYEFKVRKCTRVRSHDWTDCPFAHPGEKARRRDPRRRNYSATPCPEFRRGSCIKADSCEFAHGVFECWLHPNRYRTQPCNDGLNCRRRVCFFAHTSEELRVVPDSPPMSPSYGSELVGGMRGLQIGSKTKEDNMSPRRARICGFGYGSPSLIGCVTRGITHSGLGGFDLWEVREEKEEVPMERVESGKGIRARMYAKLSRENSLGWNRVDSASLGPDFGWVSELVK